MNNDWSATLPVTRDFSRIADPAGYVPLPEDWWIGISDVVNSTEAIRAGKYKAVNLAGAGTISAVANALNGGLQLFIFGGDGARFAVPPSEAKQSRVALSRVVTWAKRDLGLTLRVGMIRVSEVRAAGHDVRAAYWQASDHVRYAMFMGGGLEWMEAQLKNGSIGIDPAAEEREPDLTGLSCQWGPLRAKQGKILSLIVKPAGGGNQDQFAAVVSDVISILDRASDINPVPTDGPDVRWPEAAIELQSRVALGGKARWQRRLQVVTNAALAWIVFKLGLKIGSFDPSRYRREMAVNTDFRKFDDGLMLTVDCGQEAISRMQALLDDATAKGIVRYGMHTQDEALMTCIAPSVQASDHMHFVDGGDGGYAAAAAQMR